MPPLPMVILLVCLPSGPPKARFGLRWSRRMLPPRFMRLACPGVNDRPAPELWWSLLFMRADGGEQEMGGDRRRSELPRRCREMPLVELESGPE
jgi:hypothetical protein